MSENDYIAEYIKEKRPELISSIDFIVWKIGRVVAESVNALADAIKGLAKEDIEALMREEDEDEQS